MPLIRGSGGANPSRGRGPPLRKQFASKGSLALPPFGPARCPCSRTNGARDHMTAHRANDSTNAATEAFDSRAYLLARYGLRMNKKEVCFEAKKSRATIDNMRNPRHRSFDHRLVAAQVDLEGDVENGVPVLFKTPAIADWLAGN